MECCSLLYIDTLDVEHLLELARKRFIEGVPTMELLQAAASNSEKQQVALVALLDVEINFSLIMKGCDVWSADQNTPRQDIRAWCLDDIRQFMLGQGIDPAAVK